LSLVLHDGELHGVVQQCADNTPHDLDEEVDLGRDFEVLSEFQIPKQFDTLNRRLTAIEGGIHVRDGVPWIHITSYHRVKTIKLIAESLARYIYDHEGRKIEIFADGSSLAVNPSYVKLWLDLLSRTPRVAPFLTKTDPIITGLKKELSDHTVEVSVQHESMDGMFTFYDVTQAKLSIYQVASVTFDLVILLAVATYLSVLFIFLVITTRGLDDLISIFRRPPSRKTKAA